VLLCCEFGRYCLDRVAAVLHSCGHRACWVWRANLMSLNSFLIAPLEQMDALVSVGTLESGL
jgi:hypothetical protein